MCMASVCMGDPWNMFEEGDVFKAGEHFLSDGSRAYAAVTEGVRLKYGPTPTGEIDFAAGDRALWKQSTGNNVQDLAEVKDVLLQAVWLIPLPKGFRPFQACHFSEMSVAHLQCSIRMSDQQYAKMCAIVPLLLLP